VSPQMGRAFLPSEDEPGNQNVAILSDAFWRRRFGGDPSVLNSSIRLNDVSYQVVGIMPSGFPFPKGNEVHRLIGLPERIDVWLPLPLAPAETQRMVNSNYAAIARLKPGVPVASAERELNEIVRRLPGVPKDFAPQARIAPLRTEMVSRVRQGLVVLMVGIGAVLLIVCVNITNLLLARGAQRRRELAVRAALGASRSRLCLGLIGESAVLAGLGAAGGVLLAQWLVSAVRGHLPLGLPRVDEVAVDVPSLCFAVGATLACALLCGLAPGWRLSNAAPADVLRDGSRGTAGVGAGRLRAGLITFETAMCVVLLVGAGLLLNSFVRVAAIDQGFRSGNVFAAEVDLPGSRYADPKARAAFFEELLQRVRALPGVESTGAASKLPLTGSSEIVGIVVEGDPTPWQKSPQCEARIATSGYFSAMRIPILSGQVFDDRPDGPKVALIGKLTAERLWPGQKAVGRRFRISGSDMLTVAGVVADVRSSAPNSDPPMTVYRPLAQFPLRTITVVVRTGGAEPALRQV
ncbi:MAG: ABC transporter permease, partial [Candidatus Acidiferrales bacterium]